jgi:hypothetical protein
MMADEVTELQLFVEIVKAGNLSAAAKALDSSLAAMSRGLSCRRVASGRAISHTTSSTPASC